MYSGKYPLLPPATSKNGKEHQLENMTLDWDLNPAVRFVVVEIMLGVLFQLRFSVTAVSCLR
jgi:hypothetical protein